VAISVLLNAAFIATLVQCGIKAQVVNACSIERFLRVVAGVLNLAEGELISPTYSGAIAGTKHSGE